VLVKEVETKTDEGNWLGGKIGNSCF